MGIIKRLFPKGDPSETEVTALERSINELDASVAPPLMPILKEYDWPAKQVAVFENFINADKPPIPLVAYGWDTADNYVFLTKEEQGERSIDEIRAEAMANLRALPAEWVPVMRFIGFPVG